MFGHWLYMLSLLLLLLWLVMAVCHWLGLSSSFFCLELVMAQAYACLPDPCCAKYMYVLCVMMMMTVMGKI